jgi:hypothetical protein
MSEFAVGGDLRTWLSEQRGSGASFQLMAGRLAQVGVLVSHETVRQWCARLEVVA